MEAYSETRSASAHHTPQIHDYTSPGSDIVCATFTLTSICRCSTPLRSTWAVTDPARTLSLSSCDASLDHLACLSLPFGSLQIESDANTQGHSIPKLFFSSTLGHFLQLIANHPSIGAPATKTKSNTFVLSLDLHSLSPIAAVFVSLP